MDNYLSICQDEYLELLMNYQDIVSENLDLNSIAMIIDDVHGFWLKRLSRVEKELDLITRNNYCMILSGAVYLDYKENEHYIYKSLGKYHFLHDSILKLEYLFRMSEEIINIEKQAKLFKKAYNDEILVLNNARKYFYYIPLLLITDQRIKNKGELLNNGFWGIISSLFKKELRSDEEFDKLFNSYEDIEKHIGIKNLDLIIFNDDNDKKLSLRDRINGYFDNQYGTAALLNEMSEPLKFIFSMFSYIGQVLDILLTCTYFNFIPFIRFTVTFNYFALIAKNFTEDEALKIKIENAMISYIFYHRIDKDKITTMDFSSYCKKIENTNYYALIRERMNEGKVDIFSNGLNKLVTIIDGIFDQ
jgi:hypothetical protein